MADGAIVQVAPDSIIYRASALGGCLRALVAARMEYEGLEHGEVVKARFHEGHLHEDDMCGRAESKWGGLVFDREAEVKLAVTDKIAVVGHIDGLMTGDGNIHIAEYLLENKTCSKAEFESWSWDSAFGVRYRWQISVYMLATGGLPVRIQRKNRDNGQYAEEEWDSPPFSLDDIRGRVLEAEGWARQTQFPPCDNPIFPCQFSYLHEEAEQGELVVDDGDLDILARQYDRANKEEKDAKKRKEDTRRAIRAGFKGNRYETALGTGITFYGIKGREVADVDKMKKAGVWEEYKKIGPGGEGLRVTIRDKDEGEGGNNG